jgi:hypothetical protein
MKSFKYYLSIIFIVLLYSCNSNNNNNKTEKGSIHCCNQQYDEKEHDLSGTDFIYLDGKEFKLRNEKYFPIMLNYILSCREINGEFLLSPHIDYEDIGIFETNTKQEIEKQFRTHFQLIKEMGFNSLRLCFDRVGKDGDRHYYQVDKGKYFVDNDCEKILNALETVLKIAEEKELRVMLLFRSPIDSEDLKSFTINILKKFKDNPTIFSYDFINEPLYFDLEPHRKKDDVCQITWEWRRMMREYAPYQMFTIGFSEPIEVFEWDPAITPVDFIAFHTYNPMRAKNEIFWYSTYIDKPWMIGETGLPADNDSISYEDQAIFVKGVFEYVVDCEGAGFGLWDFQEGNIPDYFEAQHVGLLNHEGITITTEGDTIKGTVKPAGQIITSLSDYYKTGKKERPVNYFNMLGYQNFCIKGRVYNKNTNQAIEGAVIRGWNEYWSVGQNTYTDSHGEFTLYSNDECVHFEISAPGMSKIIFDDKLKYKDLTKGKADKNNLPNQLLEYHKISYKSLLKDLHDNPVFDFDPEKLNQSKFVSNMTTQYLEPICND